MTVTFDESTDLSAMYAAYLTVEARQARRKRIGWRCRQCPMRGFDGPGLPSFWAHWAAFHTHRSIFAGTNR